ncbi:unnamed protein product, partial [Musa hybrid cultivar]
MKPKFIYVRPCTKDCYLLVRKAKIQIQIQERGPIPRWQSTSFPPPSPLPSFAISCSDSMIKPQRRNKDQRVISQTIPFVDKMSRRNCRDRQKRVVTAGVGGAGTGDRISFAFPPLLCMPLPLLLLPPQRPFFLSFFLVS